ncbi:hypothetical protein, partial [Pontiella sp.]|uniref:DUF748 domain-containing protein n=1 Tax=Pontiella sp. TaxID=2837462 RepID=UPI003562B208
MSAKPKKILKTAGYVLGALLLLLILTGLFWLGPTVKLLVTTIGPKALGTDVRLEKLKISPIKGTISLKDFAIKNPNSFGRSNAVSLASLEVSVDMASLFSSTILVHRVEIDSPYFIYEQDRQRDNITEFIRNVQEFVNYDPDAPPKPKKTTEKDEEEKPGKVVLIEQLAIRDVQLNLANTQDHALDLGIGFESLAVSMTNGTVFLDNVYIRNPARLETPNLFTLDGLHVLMDPESIYSTNLHFKSIRILKPHAFIEHNPQTDTAGEFLKIAASLAEKMPTNAPQAAAAPPVEHAEADTGAEASAPPTQITLDLFEIDDLQLHAVNIGDPDLDVHLGMNHFTVELEKG